MMRLFDALLLLFPRGFRDEFGDEMRQVFAAQLAAARRDGRIAAWRLIARTVVPTTIAAWHERGQSHRPMVRSRSPRPGAGLVTDLRLAMRGLYQRPSWSLAIVAAIAASTTCLRMQMRSRSGSCPCPAL